MSSIESQPATVGPVLIGGREPVHIHLVDYDPRWAGRFDLLKAGLLHAIGDRAAQVEHVGSTSVPGLAAKPVVDVLVTVADVEDEDAYVLAIESTGLVLRGREPGHRVFRAPSRDVLVHVCVEGSERAGDYLVFRDWLRSDRDDRTLYATTKRRLAGHWDDMNDYADAKTDIVTEILGRARAWRDRAAAPADPA